MNKRTRITNTRLFKLEFNKRLKFYSGLTGVDIIDLYLSTKREEPKLSDGDAAVKVLTALSEKNKDKILKGYFAPLLG